MDAFALEIANKKRQHVTQNCFNHVSHLKVLVKELISLTNPGTNLLTMKYSSQLGEDDLFN